MSEQEIIIDQEENLIPVPDEEEDLQYEFEMSNENNDEDVFYISQEEYEATDIALAEKSKEDFSKEAISAADKLDISSDRYVFYPVEMVFIDNKLKNAYFMENKAVNDPFSAEKYSEEGITNGYKTTVLFDNKEDALEYIVRLKNKIEKGEIIEGMQNTNNSGETGISTVVPPISTATKEEVANKSNPVILQSIESSEGGISEAIPFGQKTDSISDDNSTAKTDEKTDSDDTLADDNQNKPVKQKKSYSLGTVKYIFMVIAAIFALWYCGLFDFSSFLPEKAKTTAPPAEGKHSGATVPDERKKAAEDAKEEQGKMYSKLFNLPGNNETDANGNPIQQPGSGQMSPENNGQYNSQQAQQNGGQAQLSPESGGTDVSQDPVYQQRMAMRQAYIELAKQAFTSKPTVEGGNWNRQDCASTQQSNQQTNANANNPFAQLDNAIQKAKQDAATATQRAAQMAGISTSGNGAPSVDINLAQNGNQNSNKEAFFNSRSSGRGYLSNTRTEKISPYTLPSGSMIPCALITGINSDLPGNITASVTENVYDWTNAHICVIPQGTRIFGTYNSAISWGQKRVQISWQRLIFPDGSTLDLGGMPGVDRRGFTGLKDKYYGHYGKMAIAALLTTGFTILPALVENRNNNGSSTYYGNSVRETAAAAAANQIGSMGNRFFNKALNQQPTVLVRPGTRFNIQVNADIPFYKAWSIARTRSNARRRK